MKTLLTLSGRIALILLAALLVVGITMPFVGTTTSAQPSSDGPTITAQDQATLTQTGETGRPEREFQGTENQTLAGRLAFGLVGLLQNVGIIAVIVLLFVWLERRFFPRLAT